MAWTRDQPDYHCTPGVGLYKPPGTPMQRVDLIEFHTPHREKRRASLALLLPLAKQLKEPLLATCIDLVIMRRPRRAGLGVLSPRRAPNLGKIRRRACLRLIPFPGTGDVLLAPTMISHPLAYVAPTTRQHHIA